MIKLDKETQLKYIKQFQKNKKRLEKECLSLWREIGLLKAKNKCEFNICRNTNNLNAHHIFSKGRFKHLKYDVDNCLILCPDHHTLGKESAHKDIFFKDKITGKKDGYKEARSGLFLIMLERKAMSVYKLDLDMEYLFLCETIKKYKNI